MITSEFHHAGLQDFCSLPPLRTWCHPSRQGGLLNCSSASVLCEMTDYCVCITRNGSFMYETIWTIVSTHYTSRIKTLQLWWETHLKSLQFTSFHNFPLLHLKHISVHSRTKTSLNSCGGVSGTLSMFYSITHTPANGETNKCSTKWPSPSLTNFT